jgi:hypothetical protein
MVPESQKFRMLFDRPSAHGAVPEKAFRRHRNLEVQKHVYERKTQKSVKIL